MKRIILPTLFIIASLAIFFGFIDPRYQEVKELRAEVSKYDQALQRSNQLIDLRDKLLSKYNTFSDSNRDKIKNFLPENIDNVHLILELNDIASDHGLMLQKISIQTSKDETNQDTEMSSDSSSDKLYNSISLHFSVTASYKKFKNFIRDLEQSLRLMDITHISFSSSQSGFQSYEIGLRTYWLK